MKTQSLHPKTIENDHRMHKMQNVVLKIQKKRIQKNPKIKKNKKNHKIFVCIFCFFNPKDASNNLIKTHQNILKAPPKTLEAHNILSKKLPRLTTY